MAEDRGTHFYSILSSGDEDKDDYFEADYLDNFKVADEECFKSAIDKFRWIVSHFESR